MQEISGTGLGMQVAHKGGSKIETLFQWKCRKAGNTSTISMDVRTENVLHQFNLHTSDVNDTGLYFEVV